MNSNDIEAQIAKVREFLLESRFSDEAAREAIAEVVEDMEEDEK